MDDTNFEGGGGQLTAADANALAQELNDRAAGREPGTAILAGSGAESMRESGSGDDALQESVRAGREPLEARERTAREGIFPPEIEQGVEIGDSPESRAQLADEYRQDSDHLRES